MRVRQFLIVLGGALVGMVASSWVVTRAQVQSDQKEQPQPITRGGQREAKAGLPASPVPPPVSPDSPSASIQNALLRVYRLPFSRPTSLEEVRNHLKTTLNVPVVLDTAALDRQDLKPEDTVQLEIDGVRLKTGLQLLLDQVGLTFRVVAEDNLLVITDQEGSDDPLAKIWAEIRELHRDIHDIQDSIDDLTDLLIPEGSDIQMRKPTIIEEMPEHQDPKDKPSAEADPAGPGASHSPSSPGPQQPGRRSGGRIKPSPPPPPAASPPAEETPARVPLGRSRKRA